jgi:hypothetical protein
MENKMTAVEWIISRFESGDMYNVEDVQFIKHQAMKMEKEQIVNAWETGAMTNYGDAKTYYEEIYGK